MDEWIVDEGVPYVILRRGVLRDLRINSRWIKGCTEKLTDAYPLILIEGGESTYWNYVEFCGDSHADVRGCPGVSECSVRMRTRGAVICR